MDDNFPLVEEWTFISSLGRGGPRYLNELVDEIDVGLNKENSSIAQNQSIRDKVEKTSSVCLRGGCQAHPKLAARQAARLLLQLGSLFRFCLTLIQFLKFQSSIGLVDSDANFSTVSHPFNIQTEHSPSGNLIELDLPKDAGVYNSKSFMKMLKKYELPSGYLYRVPNPSERIPGSDPREMLIYRDSMTTGLRFPLHPLFVFFFNEFHVIPGQLTPNSWRISTYFSYLCLTNNIEPCLRLFRSVFDMYHVLGRFSNDIAEDMTLSPLNKKKRRTDKGKATIETTVVPHSTSRVTKGSDTRAYKEFGFSPVDSTVEAEIMLGCMNEKLIEKFKNNEAAAMRRIMYTNHHRVLDMEEKVLRDLEKLERCAAEKDHEKKKAVAEVQSLLDKAIVASKKKDSEITHLHEEVDQLRKKLEITDDEAIAKYKMSAEYKSSLHMYGAESLKAAIKMTKEWLVDDHSEINSNEFDR
ncbi:Uncharacterized protein Adt_29239 [Abeliophyllum distichum]|uniref:Transposase (putative) gypsy type domain-containing protein n=1 Tax=Abeliophyllum distichum TaxID=126358 RepID=A0ABD1R7X4_9LAMI